eukprot:TRINITY_DN3557_c0_g1_i1.p2 TRINITY_DN3557_c0_g1~~TRINITY_DN3557_c0_g1_i1.p2  ORF type:complete len:50 (-),score=1.22 TRINITY_DN3557_c0_g1_i1:18-167(-)
MNFQKIRFVCEPAINGENFCKSRALRGPRLLEVITHSHSLSITSTRKYC